MSSLERRGKYSTYARRDNFKSDYSSSRADRGGRDSKRSRSRSRERFDRPLQPELSDSRRPPESASSQNFWDNSYSYDHPPRQEYNSYRDNDRADNFGGRSNFNDEPYRTQDEPQPDRYRSRDRYSPSNVFSRLDGRDSQYETRNYDETAYQRDRDYMPPKEWEPQSFDYSTPNNQMSINEPSYMNTMRERDISSEIPEFDPESSKISARHWLEILSDIGQKENWNDDVKKFWFASKLTGSAKNFLNFGNLMQGKWYDIKKAFIRTYPSDMDYHQLLKEMMAMVQDKNESILNYFNAKLAAIKTCDISGRKAISLLIAGLYDKDLRFTAYKHNFDTTEELFTFFNQSVQESKLNDKQDSFSKSKRCPDCNLEHGPDDCTLSVRKFCSRKEKLLLSKQDSISKTITWPKYIVDVKVNGRFLRGYADMDSDEITITEEAANSINLSWKKNFDRKFRSFGNNMIRSRGEVEVLLRIHKVVATALVYIVSNNDQAFPIVIGKSFVMLPNICMNVSENKIEFYEREPHMPVTMDTHSNSGLADKKYRKDEKFNPPKVSHYEGKRKRGERRGPMKQLVLRKATVYFSKKLRKELQGCPGITNEEIKRKAREKAREVGLNFLTMKTDDEDCDNDDDNVKNM